MSGLLLTPIESIEPTFASSSTRRSRGRTAEPMYPETRPNLNLPAVVVAYVPLTYLSERNALGVFALIGIACAVVASRRLPE